MPLLKGKSHIGDNIKELVSTGRPHRQALAIALKTAGEAKKPGYKLKKMFKGATGTKRGQNMTKAPDMGPHQNPTNPGSRVHNKKYLKGGHRFTD